MHRRLCRCGVRRTGAIGSTLWESHTYIIRRRHFPANDADVEGDGDRAVFSYAPRQDRSGSVYLHLTALDATAQQFESGVRRDDRHSKVQSHVFHALRGLGRRGLASASICGPCCRLCLLQRGLAVQRLRSHSTSRNVVPTEVLAGPSVCESHLKAPAARDDLVFNYADAGGFHAAARLATFATVARLQPVMSG